MFSPDSVLLRVKLFHFQSITLWTLWKDSNRLWIYSFVICNLCIQKHAFYKIFFEDDKWEMLLLIFPEDKKNTSYHLHDDCGLWKDIVFLATRWVLLGPVPYCFPRYMTVHTSKCLIPCWAHFLVLLVRLEAPFTPSLFLLTHFFLIRHSPPCSLLHCNSVQWADIWTNESDLKSEDETELTL